MPYGDKKSYSFFKMKYQGNNSAFPFKSPLRDESEILIEGLAGTGNKPLKGDLETEGDMSKLRSQQARSRKGISEWQHFKQPSQGDEPRVEYNIKKKK